MVRMLPLRKKDDPKRAPYKISPPPFNIFAIMSCTKMNRKFEKMHGSRKFADTMALWQKLILKLQKIGERSNDD